MNENEERAKTILAQIEYVTLATSSPDGGPWNAPCIGYLVHPFTKLTTWSITTLLFFFVR
jgi:hypothetical protein